MKERNLYFRLTLMSGIRNSTDGHVHMYSAFSDEGRHRRLEWDSIPQFQLLGDF
jgi:hypothetical protein